MACHLMIHTLVNYIYYTEHCSVWSYQFYRYDRHYYYYYGADEDFRF